MQTNFKAIIEILNSCNQSNKEGNMGKKQLVNKLNNMTMNLTDNKKCISSPITMENKGEKSENSDKV